MDAQRGLSVSGHRNTVLCLHLTSDTYHVTPSGRAPRARGKFWIRRVKLRIFRPDPKSHKSEGFPAAQIFKTHKSQNTYCRSAHFSKAVKIVGAQNPSGTPWQRPSRAVVARRKRCLFRCGFGSTEVCVGGRAVRRYGVRLGFGAGPMLEEMEM